jgi:hypothetical protein
MFCNKHVSVFIFHPLSSIRMVAHIKSILSSSSSSVEQQPKLSPGLSKDFFVSLFNL